MHVDTDSDMLTLPGVGPFPGGSGDPGGPGGSGGPYTENKNN